MVKASGLVYTAMKARGVAKFPISTLAKANQKKKRGLGFAIWRLVRLKMPAS